jgi:hypothetical protein
MFDPEKFGEAMGTAIREAVAPLIKRIGELEAKLSAPVDVVAEVQRSVASAVGALPVPKDGKDAAEVDTDALVKSVLALIPAPTNGKDGAAGADGKSISLEDIRPVLDEALAAVRSEATKMIDAAVNAIPVPKDGKDGIDGLNGERGEKGADGLGLAGAMIDRDGALQITLTNGEVKNLGPVVGKNGNDGKDGLSLDGFDLQYLPDSHEVALKATAAGRVKELRYPAGGIRPAGYWREGTKAQAGEAWVHDGSLWIAVKDCQSKPATNDDGWIIAARKGRDGERGSKGVDGTPLAPIKLGV